MLHIYINADLITQLGTLIYGNLERMSNKL